jgi:peptide/nickel transport system substrate-binding protein
MDRRDFLTHAAALAASTALPGVAAAQGRADALLSISEAGPNALDCQVPGANRSVYEVVWNTYDRLITFGTRTDAAGNLTYDYRNPQGELAEDMVVTPASLTFRLRRDATFHDGAPVTAQDVKYSMDRCLNVGAVPTTQLQAASITHTEQFVVVDDHTFRVDMDKPDKIALLAMGIPTSIIYHADAVRAHATKDDPWGVNWTRNNPAGGGAYRVASYTPGQEIVLARNEAWRCGKKPAIPRIIWRVVPSAGTRRALLERGDADLLADLPPKDASELANNKALRVLGIPMEGTVQFFGVNLKTPPFDQLKVRQAIAAALPYRKIMEVALYGRARPLFGGPPHVTSTDWPQPGPYDTDIPRARQLLAEAGLPNGFDTTLSFDLSAGDVMEPACELMQEGLREAGIRVTLDKVPGANWRTMFSAKKLAMQVNVFGAWFVYPDYYFAQAYSSLNTIFNTSGYVNPAFDKVIDDAHFTTDPKQYDRDCIAMYQRVFDDLPTIPLYQPWLNVAMRGNVSGYCYWFHRQTDYRCLQKT